MVVSQKKLWFVPSQDNMDIKNQVSDHQFLISTEDVFSYTVALGV